MAQTSQKLNFSVKQSNIKRYTYTNQVDIADVIKHRQRNFMLKLQTCSNLVISRLSECYCLLTVLCIV